jgi:hypothetical protein
VTQAITEEQCRVYEELVQKRSVLLLGAAGTGKSEFIRHVCKNMAGKVAVAAPTAMAAMNLAVGAVTIHSLFQIPPSATGYFDADLFALKSRAAEVLKSINYLVVDEISMVRPDLFDLMENLARRARGSDNFFGGLCLLLVGDFHQLPPVIRSDEFELFRRHYGHSNAFLFDAKSLRDAPLQAFALTKIFRQKSSHFVKILGAVSGGKLCGRMLTEINGRALNGNAPPKESLIITPYRAAAERKNEEELDALPGIIHEYVGRRVGTFRSIADDELPSPERLLLKEGATVVFTCNGAGWVNGSMGTVRRLGKNGVEVLLRGRKKAIPVGSHSWTHVLPNGGECVETGSYGQIPLRLGYAMTVHRTQGKTCDSIVIQRDRRFFAHGQLYVALSRARSLDSIHLSEKISSSDAMADGRVLAYCENLRLGGVAGKPFVHNQ